jgi:hypothetical protein
MSRRIFNKKLVLERKGQGKRNPVTKRFEDGKIDKIEGFFSVQPYKNGKSQIVLPEGVKEEDAFILYGITPIQSSDQFKKIKADRVAIQGQYYLAFNSENWTFTRSKVSYYRSIFIREDKLQEGVRQ